MTLPAQDIVERLAARAAECATASASDDKDRFMNVVAKFTRADGVLMTEAAHTISRLTADNEALRTEAEAFRGKLAEACGKLMVAEARVTALEAEVGRLRAELTRIVETKMSGHARIIARNAIEDRP